MGDVARGPGETPSCSNSSRQVPVFKRHQRLVESTQGLKGSFQIEACCFNRVVAFVATALEGAAMCEKTLAKRDLWNDNRRSSAAREHVNALTHNERCEHHVRINEEQIITLRQGCPSISLRAPFVAETFNDVPVTPGNFERLIGRCIVDDDQLDRTVVLATDALEAALECAGRVPSRDHDRDQRSRGTHETPAPAKAS